MNVTDWSSRAPVMLLGLAAVGWYAAARAAAQALAGGASSPMRRALGYCLPGAAVAIGAIIVGRPEIAVGLIFASSVACLTLVLGITTLAYYAAQAAEKEHANPSAEPPKASSPSRLWGFLLPVSLIVLLIGFHGTIGWIQIAILLTEGLTLFSFCQTALPKTDHEKKFKSGMSLQFTFALLAAAVAAWAGVRATRDISNSLNLAGCGLVTALMLAPALVLPLIGSGSTLASTGRYDQAVLIQVGFVLFNLCAILPLIAVMWLTRPYWNIPVRAVMTNSVTETSAPATSPATTSTSAPAIQADEDSPSDLPYPLGVWRVDAVLLVAVGLLLLPVTLGRWSMGAAEGLGLMLLYLFYMGLTAVMADEFSGCRVLGNQISTAIMLAMSASESKIQIDRKPFEGEMRDVMEGAGRWEIKVHDHGLVALVDVMPRLVPAGKTADFAIVQAARVSYGQGTKQVNEDRGLIRYLLRHRHTTPLEMVEFKFHCVMPIFIARQWIRHRTANVNEYSARYSVVKDRFYKPTPDYIRKQSAANRQGGGEPSDDMTANEFLGWLDKMEAEYDQYEKLVERGLARELARIALPVSVYTEWYWKCDLHNIFHFLSLRMDEHAQAEIRDYANAMFALIEPIVPIAAEGFMDYNFKSLHLSRLEVEALKTGKPLATENKRELAEWEEKRKKFGK